MPEMIALLDLSTKKYPEKIESANFKIFAVMITKQSDGKYHNRILGYFPSKEKMLRYYWENGGERHFESKVVAALQIRRKVRIYQGNEDQWKSMDKDGRFVYSIDNIVYHFETNQLEFLGWYAVSEGLEPHNLCALDRADVRKAFPDLNSTGFSKKIENKTKENYYSLQLDAKLELRIHKDLVVCFRSGVKTEAALQQKYGQEGSLYKKQELNMFAQEYRIDTYCYADYKREAGLKKLNECPEIDVLQWKEGRLRREKNIYAPYTLIIPENGDAKRCQLDVSLVGNPDVIICNFEVWNKDMFVAYVERTVDTYRTETVEYQTSFVIVRSEYISADMTMSELYNRITEVPNAEVCNSAALKLKYDLEKTDIKYIPFYLPQFHENEENNKWWGKGFTEWTNVRKAKPQFQGHRQPRVPGELGYYDLDGIETQEKQIALARKMGIYGFCYYYYWFNGKRLLRKPVDQFLEHKELDFPFCICWANESWTRRWDGREQDVLMEQVHTKQSDKEFIRDVLPILKDDRYIKYQGRPILIVYRIELFPSPKETIQRWREICKQEGIPDLYVAVVQSFDCIDNRIYGADAAIEFPPHKIPARMINDRIKDRIYSGFEGSIYSYRDLVTHMELIKKREYNYIPGIMREWDNTARKGNKAHIFTEYSEELFIKWLTKDCVYADMYSDEKMIFINAWNEWAEGTYLEPEGVYDNKLIIKDAYE